MEHVVSRALSENRDVLLEHELLGMLHTLGLAVPAHRYVPLADLKTLDATRLGELGGKRGVLKVVSERILHKSDVGGVKLIGSVTPDEVRAVAQRMLDGLPAELRSAVRGMLLEEAVPFDAGLGRELLLGMRHSAEFGLVFTVGFGGTYVEALAAATKADQSTILFKPGVTSGGRLAEKLKGSLFFRWASGGIRGVDALAPAPEHQAQLERWVEAMGKLREAVERAGRSVTELEFNPLVWNRERKAWMPVDALMRIGPAAAKEADFPIDRLRRGLHPKSIAILGASATQMNVGRIILRCMLDNGFPKERVFAVREDVAELDGAPCVKSIEALPSPVDLLVVAVGAAAVPELLDQAIRSGKLSGSVLLIPGGMGETEGGKGIEQQVRDVLARAPAGARPALIGNNSLGLVSKPDRLDSLFIPREKLPRVTSELRDVALISQSGAFIITALTKLDFAAPNYQISLGNQIDARISHFVEALADAPGLTTYALYVEGLKPGDGQRLAAQVRGLCAAGRDVIVYKAGRSALGQTATMGHTASIAGDYRVFADLLGDAGALVADTFADFVDLVRISATLHGRDFTGSRAAFMSNAGYESVGLADNHKGPGYDLTPAKFAPATIERMSAVLKENKLAQLVTVANPLDLTPMANDAVHEAFVRAALEDPGVDLGIFGCVPLTAAVQSLPRGASERDVFDAPKGYAQRLIGVFRESRKPFAVVIDAGPLYDPMASLMQGAGIPIFRAGDHAARVVGRYVAHRLAHRG